MMYSSFSMADTGTESGKTGFMITTLDHKIFSY